MKQLSTDITAGFIVYHDKSVHTLTPNEWDNVSQQFDHGGTHLRFKDGTIVSVSSIAKVMTKDEYYREYPENILPVYQYLPPTNIMQKPWNVARTKKAMEQMIRGFKSAFVDKNIGINAAETLKHMEARLSLYAN
jgi:hypothetical protein